MSTLGKEILCDQFCTHAWQLVKELNMVNSNKYVKVKALLPVLLYVYEK